MTLPIGTYTGHPTTCSFGHSKNKGTPYVRVTFQIDGPSPPDDLVDWIGYFTEKTEERTIASLQVLGWQGDLRDFSSCRKPANIVVEHEQGQNGRTYPKVQWVNSVGPSRHTTEDVPSDFAARIKARAAEIQARSPAPPAVAANGRAVAPSRSMGDAHEDDQIPF